jgi:secreted PhoX family phosphatase
MRRTVLAVAVAVLACGLASTANAQIGPPQTDPAGLIDLPAGYSYTDLYRSCDPGVQSTEDGTVWPMPDDPDANVVFPRPGGGYWLLSNHELTDPRDPFQGDAGKCAVTERTPGDDDSDGWGSVSRITLAQDGTTVLNKELITTGLHDLCAGAETPWKTYLTNEEFPFVVDPDKKSGWVWEINPATGAQTRATGMGWFSHEQEARVGKAWVLTDDRGNNQYLYKFVPDRANDLTTGSLYGLVFNRVTNTGTWVGPLDPLAPEADMAARVGPPTATNSFSKAEGVVTGPGGDSVTFSESGAGADPGRVFVLTDVDQDVVHGYTLVEGNFGRLARPDNLRYTDAGDLFIMEDHSASDFARGPTGNVNQVWVLPRGEEGAANLILFAQTSDEPTGPWFSNDNHLLYLSVQAERPRVSHVIAIQAPQTFNYPYD